MSRWSASLRPSPSVFCATVGDEAVLYEERVGTYFALNPVALRIWVLAGKGLSLGAILTVLESEYVVESAQLSEDLLALVSEMESLGLWGVQGDARSAE